MFAMANAVAIKQADVSTLESRLYEVAEGLTVTIPYEVQAKSVRISGFDEAEAAAAGKFADKAGNGSFELLKELFNYCGFSTVFRAGEYNIHFFIQLSRQARMSPYTSSLFISLSISWRPPL